MNRFIIFISILVLSWVTLPLLCRADLIYLRNGKVVEGEISETSPGIYLMKSKGGSFTVSKDMILRIVRSEEADLPANLIIEIGSVVRKEEAQKLMDAVNSLGFTEVHIVDEAPYYKIQLGPYRKETEAVAIAQKIDAAKLPNVYPGGSHLFRIESTAVPGNSATTAESNIALAVNGAGVKADSMLAEYPPENAIDGNGIDLKSRWLSDTSSSIHWLELDFGTPKAFSRIELYTGEAHSVMYILKDFSLQYWTGSEWKDIIQRKNNLVENPQFTFNEITAQRVRLYITRGSYRDTIARVYEMKVIGAEIRKKSEEFDRETLTERLYQIRLLQPANFLTAQPVNPLAIGTTEWYTLSCTVSYSAQSTSVLSASILPDATEFWTDVEFRNYLGLTPDDYNTTINFDTQRTPGYSNVQGNDEVSFTLKTKAPLKPGTYTKTLRISLLNPDTRNSLVFQEIPFILQVK